MKEEKQSDGRVYVLYFFFLCVCVCGSFLFLFFLCLVICGYGGGECVTWRLEGFAGFWRFEVEWRGSWARN